MRFDAWRFGLEKEYDNPTTLKVIIQQCVCVCVCMYVCMHVV